MKRHGNLMPIGVAVLLAAGLLSMGTGIVLGKTEKEIKAELAACLNGCDAKHDLAKCKSNPPSQCVVARRACNSACKDKAAKSTK